MTGARERGGRPPARLRRRLLALVLGLLATPLAAEIGYRLTRRAGLGPTTNPAYVRYDAELGWAYRAGARARHRTSEFDVEIEIHAHGFRGAEWESQGAGRSVLVLGDSYAFGWGVEAEQGFSALLAARGWRVFNAAVSGYGNDQELLLLRRLAPELQPDLVVVVFCPNDLFENRSRVAYGAHKPWFELTDAGLELRGQPVPRPLWQRVSHLARALAKVSWERRFALAPRDRAAEWRLAHALFDAMRDALPEHVQLVLLSEGDELDAFAAGRAGVVHLDLRPALESAHAPTRFPIDGHWNAAGHALVADALLELIAVHWP